jgi:hypothetical protein
VALQPQRDRAALDGATPAGLRATPGSMATPGSIKSDVLKSGR